MAHSFSDEEILAIRQALFAEGELSWLLHSGQKEIYDSLRALPVSTRQAVLEIARRFGKSFLAAVMALEDCLRTPNAQVLYVAPTLKQCSSIVTPLIREICEWAPEGLVQRTKSEYRWNFANGSTLILGGFDTAVESFRGLRANAIYADESASASPEEFLYAIRSILLPTLAHSRGRIVHLTTPSPLPSHPFHDEIVPACALKNAHFIRTIHDNPMLDEEDRRQLCQEQGGEDSVAWKREFLCQRAIETSSLVVPEFDESLHVSDEPVGYSNWLVAADFGGVKDKTVALLCAYDWANACLVFLDEYVADANTGTGEIVRGFKAIESHAPITPHRVVDAPGQLLIDLRQTHAYPCSLPSKDNWEAALNNMRAGMKEGRVRVHPRCKFLIATLKSATFNKQRNDFARSEALGHCDAIAAAMYGYRMVDRHNNPFPRQAAGEGQWQRPSLRIAEDKLVAAALNPWAAKKRR